MGKKYRKYKNAVEKYLASEKGRRFFHIAYSVGASIVIVGALFKINHWPLGSYILLIGMVTEAFIFFLSAFDRPSKDYKWEEVYPVLATDNGVEEGEENPNTRVASAPRGQGAGATVIIGGVGGNSNAVASNNGTTISGGGVIGGNTILNGGTVTDSTEVVDASEKYAQQLKKASENMEKFAEITDSLAQTSNVLLSSFQSINDNSQGLGNNTQGYISQMETLNRNLAGLNTIYEIQLKGVSGQINTIEQINAGLDRIKNLYNGSLVDSSIFKNETEKMAQQLAELNRVYARLLQAMTVNMNMNIGGFGSSGATNASNNTDNQ